VLGLGHYTSEALWGSVWARDGLDIETRTLLTLAVLTSLQRLAQLRTYLNSALNIGIGIRQIEEVLVQCSASAGFPVTVNALELLRDVLEGREPDGPPSGPTAPAGVEVAGTQAGGLAAPSGDVAVGGAAATADELDGRGEELQRRLFGGHGPASEGENRGTSPAEVLSRIETRYVFGDLLVRPGLSLEVRVGCMVASLVALRDLAELARWLEAGLRVGLSEEWLGESILHVAYYAGFPAARAAMAVAAPVFEAGRAR
jgi:4-carboxymuconolactone decarboxylase